MIHPFPPGIRTQNIETDGATIYYTRIGGQGPAVVMLHGFADTGDMWAPLAEALIASRTVIVPDLRGMGLSSHPPRGYDKKTQGQDVARVLDKLGVDTVDLITHDIGNMVGYAFAAQHPSRVTRWVAMDAPLPGIGPWDEILKNPLLWHFNFRGPDMERLVQGRERIYLDRFWNELSADPKSTRRRAGTMPRSMRGRAPCIRRSNSLPPFPRMRSTTRHLPRKASLRCPCWRSAPRSPSARRRPTSCALSRATSRCRWSPIRATGCWRNSRLQRWR
jgi:pimeloyl-ACP methyl ester carboxylesterase